MAQQNIYQYMLQPGNFNEYTIGALLGFEFTEEMMEQAEGKAEHFLVFMGFLPSEDDLIFCGKTLHDAAGNVLVDVNGAPETCTEVRVLGKFFVRVLELKVVATNF
jgi:surfactin synthase thioesterase subunit